MKIIIYSVLLLVSLGRAALAFHNDEDALGDLPSVSFANNRISVNAGGRVLNFKLVDLNQWTYLVKGQELQIFSCI